MKWECGISIESKLPEIIAVAGATARRVHASLATTVRSHK